MKKIYLILLVISFSITSSILKAQVPAWLWSKSAGNTLNDMTWSVAPDVSGNVYVLGAFTSPTIAFGAITLTNTGVSTSDAFLVKYDLTGTVLWAKNYGTTNNDEGRALAVDGAGNVYFSGFFNTSSVSIGSFTLSNNGNDDIFLAKSDPSGTVQWAKSYGNSGDNRPSGVIVDASGDIGIAGGYNNSAITIGTFTLSNAGNFDFFYAQFTAATGNPFYAKGYGSSDRDNVNSISFSPASGFYYLAGDFKGPTLALGTTTLTNANTGTKDGFVMEINNSQTVSWATRIGNTGDDQVNSVKVTGAGPEICFAGEYSSSSITIATNTLTNAGSGTSDIFITGYNASHTPLWAKTAGGSGNDAGYGLTKDNLNNIYLAGVFASANITLGTTTLTNASTGTSDIYAAGYDISGNSLWAKSVGGTGNDFVYSIASDISTNLYFGGWFDSPSLAFSPNPTLTNGGTNDAFVSKLAGISLGIQSIDKNKQITFYPNPTKGILNFETEKEMQLIITNVLGVKVFEEKFSAGKQSINLTSQASGVYFYTLIGEKSYSGKLIKD